MRVEELRAAIMAVPTIVALDQAATVLWGEVAGGRISEDQATALHDTIGARRKALQGRAALREAVRRKADQGVTLWAWKRLEDRARSIGRRRRLAASGPLPPSLAASFTTSEQAVLRIVGDTCRDRGSCDLTLGEIAARAGCSRTSAQGALRLAARLGLVHVEERRRPWQRSLPNIITLRSAEWRTWLERGPRGGRGGGFGKSDPTEIQGSRQASIWPSATSRGSSRMRFRDRSSSD